jgi:PKD repeat protein
MTQKLKCAPTSLPHIFTAVIMGVVCSHPLFAQDLNVDILSPSDGECVTGEYTIANPYDNGSINANNVGDPTISVDLLVTDSIGDEITIKLETKKTEPRYLLPGPQPCTVDFTANFEERVAACGGVGYCVFSFGDTQCICAENSDCNGGQGLCREDSTCGCLQDNHCGDGERCSAEGDCVCDDATVCPSGTCNASGACACASDNECNAGLTCIDGECSELVGAGGGESFESIPEADFNEPLPRSISVSYQLRNLLDDSELNLNVISVSAYEFGLEDPTSIDSIEVYVDQEYPVLTAAPCIDDGDCSEVDYNCDPISFRCRPAATIIEGTCRAPEDFSQGLSSDLSIEDNYDAAPLVEFLDPIEEGCFSISRIKLSDSCGNAQIVNVSTQRAPSLNEVTASLEGYRCFETPCNVDEGAVTLSSGDAAGRAQILTTLTSPNGCYDQVDRSLIELDEQGAPLSSRPFFSDEILEALPAEITSFRYLESGTLSSGGPFSLFDGAQLTLTTNGTIAETITFRADDFFDITEAFTLDVAISINSQSNEVIATIDDNSLILRTKRLGNGVSLSIAGDAAELLGFTAENETHFAAGSGDGEFRAEVNVYACGLEDPIAQDTFDLTITEPIRIEIGGPYSVDQGDDLLVSAANSFVPVEFGGIVNAEWDIDGDGIFELFGDFVDLNEVEIDTLEDGERTISFRVTTGLGVTADAQTTVEIRDVNPVCTLPQAEYQVSEGVIITFTAGEDTSPGHESDPITQYRWTFGDQENEEPILTAESTITHLYNAQGEYTLTLSAEDPDSSCPPVTATVVVTGVVPIIENIGLLQPEIQLTEGDSVTFTSGDTRAGATSDPLIFYKWSFNHPSELEDEVLSGNPTEIAGLLEPSFQYDQDGSYTVCLEVADIDDTIGPECFEVIVTDLKPTVIWQGDLQGDEGTTFTFNAEGTISGGEADQLSTLRWDFGDGSPPVFRLPGELEIEHVFNGDGDFTVRLTAIDEEPNDIGIYLEQTVRVLDVSPRAALSFSFNDPDSTVGYEDEPVTLDASASFSIADSDPILRYRWNFGDDSAEQVTNGPIHEYAFPDGPQIYEVTVTVEDQDESTASASVSINIENVEPIVNIIASAQNVTVGEEVTFNLDVIDVLADRPGTSDQPLVIEWDMGDGTTYSGLSTVDHIFGSEGPVTISVHYEDGDGGEVDAELPYTVEPRRADILDPTVTVDQREGTLSPDSTTPLGEYVDDPPEGEVYYLREGDLLSMSIRVRSARLSNGDLDPANPVFVDIPEGAQVEYVPILPPAGSPSEGEEERDAQLTWRPNYFQRGCENVRLTVEGELTGSITTREWRICVIDGGTPMLVAATGSLRTGRVILYEYEKENDRRTFNLSREVPNLFGAQQILKDDLRSRLFASVPLSGYVAVLGGYPVNVLRRIRTGAGAYGMAWAAGMIWVVNAEDKTLSAINPSTLKVIRTVPLPGMTRPLSIIAVGEAQGLGSERLIVGDGRNGQLLILDAQGVLAGEGQAAVQHSLTLGGSLIRLSTRDDQLFVVDGKTRKIYYATLNSLLVSGDVNAFNSIDQVSFVAKDILYTEHGLWIATGNGLYSLTDEADLTLYEINARRLFTIGVDYIGQDALLISDGENLRHYTIDEAGDLSEIEGMSANANLVHSMSTFIQRPID